MKLINNKILTSEVFEELHNNEILLSYYGFLDFDLSSVLIKRFKSALQLDALQKSVSNKVYTCFAEGIENAYKHQKKGFGVASVGIVMVSKRFESYFISLGNLISISSKGVLENKIESLLSMNMEEIKYHIKERLILLDPLVHSSAEIGLAKIALQCDGKMSYEMKELDSGELFFLLNIVIN